MARPVVHLLRLRQCPIYEQLQIEEALLRSTKQNWFILNDGANSPAVVMGVSGFVHQVPRRLWASSWVKNLNGGLMLIQEGPRSRSCGSGEAAWTPSHQALHWGWDCCSRSGHDLRDHHYAGDRKIMEGLEVP
jgi:hypothetical protein